MKNNLIALLMFLVSQVGLAENSVTFEGVGNPGFLTIDGKGGKVVGELNIKGGKSSGTFEVDLKKFDTGIELRNKHMLEKYLEVDKFPSAKLILDPVIMPKGGYFNWKGNLSMHGVIKPVNGVAFLEGKQIEAKFNITTTDFKIKKAIYLGVGLDEKISIVVHIDMPPT
jgi:polyisoprenoid-binding protein YceI